MVVDGRGGIPAWRANPLVSLKFWTAETCHRFGFTAKTKRTVEKSSPWVFEQRSQSDVVPSHSIEHPVHPAHWFIFSAQEIDSYIAFSSAQKLRCATFSTCAFLI